MRFFSVFFKVIVLSRSCILCCGSLLNILIEGQQTSF